MFFLMILLLYHPISQGSQADSCCHADGYISQKRPPMPVLKHLKAFVGKSGEGGEASAQACGEEQAPRMGGCTISAEQGEKQPDEKASHEVDHQCTQRKTLSTDILHPGRNEVSQCASDEAADAYDT